MWNNHTTQPLPCIKHAQTAAKITCKGQHALEYLFNFKSIKQPEKLVNHVSKLPTPIRGEVMTIAEQLATIMFKDKVEQQVKEEVTQQVKEEVTQQVKEEVTQQVKEEVTQQVKEEVTQQVKEEVTQQVKEEVTQQVKEEVTQQVKDKYEEQARQREEQAIKSTTIQTVIKALKNRIEVSLIADITNLSIDQVLTIKAEHNL